ncbi:MAG: SLATT domain-containing protein [Clostridium sp.]
MEKEKNDCEKYKITRQNYINMKKRLENNNKFYSFILTTGSLYLIILGISDLYFKAIQKNVINSDLVSYISIIYSLLLFTISLLLKPEETRRKTENLREGILKLNEEIEGKGKYIEIIRGVINREDIDYYTTAREFLKNNSIESEDYIKEMKNIQQNLRLRVYYFYLNYKYYIYILGLVITTLGLF